MQLMLQTSRLADRVSGYVFTLAGGAVAFKSKLQPTVATSSTEAEFIAAVSAAKVAKYLRFVFLELGFSKLSPLLSMWMIKLLSPWSMNASLQLVLDTLTSNTLQFKSGELLVMSSYITFRVSSTPVTKPPSRSAGNCSQGMLGAPWDITVPLSFSLFYV